MENLYVDKNALIFYQILLTNYFRKCVEITMENLHVDTGTYRIKGAMSRGYCCFRSILC